MKIVIDAFGGDSAPVEIVKGSILALNKHDDIVIVLAGNEQKISEVIKKENFCSDRLKIINAEDIITAEDVPTVAIRSKTNSSLVVAFDYLKNNKDVAGLISAGNTGAILTGAFLKLGRIKNISRPAMAPILPASTDGKVLLLDCGANMDCKPENLLHFAIMGSEYMKIEGVKNPRIALLNVGTEETKGNELTKQTYPLLKNAQINFVGNIEARDIVSGDFDVVVADGFDGNVALKTIEGTAKFVVKNLKSELTSSLRAKIGALLLKKNLKNLKNKMDYAKFGGAPFLGVSKIVIKSHGDSKAETICICVEQVMNMHNKGIIEKIEKAVCDEK